MEESIKNQTQQQEQSLLSSKLNVENNNPHIQLITDINHKNSLNLSKIDQFSQTEGVLKDRAVFNLPKYYSTFLYSRAMGQKLPTNTGQIMKKHKIKMRNIIQQSNNNSLKKQQKLLSLRFIRNSKNDKNKLMYEQLIQQLDEINGQGFILISDGRVFQGNFIDGMPQGPLKITFSNGLIYYGPVYKYKPHGIGSLFFPKGQKYEGEFSNGQFNGEGCFYDAEGNLLRKGQWKWGQAIN